MDWWSWIQEHPGAAAWIVFAFVTAFIYAWNKSEVRLKAWAAKSETKTDDKVIAAIGRVVSLAVILVDFVRELIPHFVAKRKEVEDRQ